MDDQLFCTGIYEDGYGMISKAVMRNKNISVTAKALYAYICSFAGSGGGAFPSLELMCSELKIAEKKMYQCRKELIENNLITVKKERIGRKYSSNIYTLVTNPNWIKNKEKEPSQNEQVENGHIKNEPVQNDSVQDLSNGLNTEIGEASQNGHVQFEPCPKEGTISNNIYIKKKKEKTEFDELIEAYTKNKELQDNLYEFIKMRKGIKAAITTTGLKRILNKLNTFAKSDEDKIEILNDSIMNSWRGVFPLKESSKSNVIPITTKTKITEIKIDQSKIGDL